MSLRLLTIFWKKKKKKEPTASSSSDAIREARKRERDGDGRRRRGFRQGKICAEADEDQLRGHIVLHRCGHWVSCGNENHRPLWETSHQTGVHQASYSFLHQRQTLYQSRSPLRFRHFSEICILGTGYLSQLPLFCLIICFLWDWVA